MCNFYIAPFHTKCSERFTQLLPRQTWSLQSHLNFLGSIRMRSSPQGEYTQHSTMSFTVYSRVPILNTPGWSEEIGAKHVSQAYTRRRGSGSNPRPSDHESNALTTTPPALLRQNEMRESATLDFFKMDDESGRRWPSGQSIGLMIERSWVRS